MAYNPNSIGKSDEHPLRADTASSARDLLADLHLASAAAESAALESAEIIYHPNAAARTNPVGGVVKRAIDVAAVCGIALLASPLILAVAACAKLTSKGPLLFGHRRVGFRGREFTCWKFRTMVVDAEDRLAEHLATNEAAAQEWAETQKLRNDPRITSVGGILRKTSLDELPQLLNVLRGDMSLVGPRPVTAEELARYGSRRPAYLSARPGITGLWQVSGRNSTTYERRTALDEEYVRHWSLFGDLKIVLRTIPELLPSSRAY